MEVQPVLGAEGLSLYAPLRGRVPRRQLAGTSMCVDLLCRVNSLQSQAESDTLQMCK